MEADEKAYAYRAGYANGYREGYKAAEKDVQDGIKRLFFGDSHRYECNKETISPRK